MNVTESECLKGTEGHFVESSIFELQTGSQICVLPCTAYDNVPKFKHFTEKSRFSSSFSRPPPSFTEILATYGAKSKGVEHNDLTYVYCEMITQ